MICSLDEFIHQALTECKQLDFVLFSFYPRLSGASRDSDPTAEGLYARSVIKVRCALRDGLREKIDAVNSYSSARPRLFKVYDKDAERFGRISEGHKLFVIGRDTQMDSEGQEDGVWIERCTKCGYEPVMKA